MILIDKLFTGSLRFVLEKVATAANAELDDEGRLKEELLASRMKVELGEMSEEEFAGIEAEILARLRRIREERGEGRGLALDSRVVGADVSTDVSFQEAPGEEPDDEGRAGGDGEP